MPNVAIQKAILFASTAIAFAATVPAMAQEQNSDIIVTARRVEERLQDVPISITVFNQQQLTNKNVVNAGDLATYTPSLSSNARFGAENTSFAIRGFVQDPGTSPSVAVYFADVATLRAAGGTTLGNGAGPGAFFDLANVQVLKGAQGTLFGRNTTGGAVLLVPQKPTGKFEGYVEGSIGNYDMRRVQAVVNVPVLDTLRVRVGLDRQTRDGYLNNYSGIGPKDFSDTDYWAVRASVVADLTPNLENYLIATWSDSDTSGFLPQVFNCAPSTQISAAAAYQANLGCAQVARQNARGDFYGVENATPSPRQHTQQWQLINTTTWKASDTLTIKNIASYGEFREYFRASVYGENLIIPAGAGPNAGQSLIKAQTTPLAGQSSAAESTFTEELQFQGTALDNRLNWQAGGYAELSEPLGFSGSASASSAVCPTANTFECVSTGIPTSVSGGNITSIINQRINKQKFQNYGVYGQATYKLTDQFSVTGGLRYTWDSTTAITRQAVYILGAAPSPTPTQLCQTGNTANNCEQAFHIANSKPTWLLGLDFKPTDDILLYAKYTRGYRSGGLKIDGGPVFNTFEPEKVDTYEGGFKTSFNGAVKGTLNLSAFYSDFLSQQLAARLDPTPANPNQQPPQTIASGARSRVYGVEVEGSISPFRGLNIDANYAYINTRLKAVAAVSGTSTLYFPPVATGTAVGYPLGYAPQNKWTVTATYTLPLDETVGRISVGATFSHSDSQITSSSYVIPVAVNNPTIPANVVGYNVGRIPAINLLNMNANWNSVAGLPVDLGFFVTNLTKQKYVASVFGGIGAFGYDARALGEPRMYGFRLKYRFG
ncbi:MAG: TonB-dependent receptor, partial [Sphingobium sp.]